MTGSGDAVAVLLASHNKGKVAEFQRMLAIHTPQLRLLGLDDVAAYDEPVEDQPDFAGNALLKARAGLAATGLPTLADDSGLCVDALNGMPGVLSARWSGLPKDDARNNELLLQQLADVSDERRGAHFACAVAFVHPDGTELVVHGRMDGWIIRECRGSGGFGYDVLFVAQDHLGDGLTSAELEPDEKDRISHRSRALREMAPQVVGALGV
jgi:XTP/dITP diphosphohydrolase